MSTFKVANLTATGAVNSASVATQGSNTSITADTSGQFIQLAVSAGASNYFTNAFANAACLKGNNAILIGVGSGDYSVKVNPVSTASTSVTTGTVIVTGGMGVSGALYPGSISSPGSIGAASVIVVNTDPVVTVNQSGNTMQMAMSSAVGNYFSNSFTNAGILKGTSGILLGVGSGAYSVRINTVGTVSNNPTAGTMIVTGGVGITGDVNVTGTLSTNQAFINMNGNLMTYIKGTFTPYVHANINDSVVGGTSTNMSISAADWVQVGKMVTVTVNFTCSLAGAPAGNAIIVDLNGCPQIATGTRSLGVASDRFNVTGLAHPVYIAANGIEFYSNGGNTLTGYQVMPMTISGGTINPCAAQIGGTNNQVFAFTVTYITP